MVLELLEEILALFLGWVVYVRNVTTPDLCLRIEITPPEHLVLDLLIVEDHVASVDYAHRLFLLFVRDQSMSLDPRGLVSHAGLEESALVVVRESVNLHAIWEHVHNGPSVMPIWHVR